MNQRQRDSAAGLYRLLTIAERDAIIAATHAARDNAPKGQKLATFSRKAIARELGVSHKTLRNWERLHRRCPIHTIIKWRAIVGL